MPFETDYVMRAVEQLVQALARVLGLRKAGRIDDAVAEVDAALSGIAGLDARLLLAVGADAVAAALREPVRMQVAGRLSAERASLLAQQGDAAGARRWRRVAADLYAASVRAGGTLDADGEAARAAAEADEEG